MYQIRRLLTLASERLDTSGEARLRGLLEAGDPHGEVRTAWHAKETVRGVYDIDEPDVAGRYCRQLASDSSTSSTPGDPTGLIDVGMAAALLSGLAGVILMSQGVRHSFLLFQFQHSSHM